MFAKPYLVVMITTLFFSAVGWFYWALESRDREISSLREELLNKHVELAKQNHEMQKQANEFHAFNSQKHEYEKSLINKYSIPSLGDDPCNSGILDTLLRKSFKND